MKTKHLALIVVAVLLVGCQFIPTFTFGNVLIVDAAGSTLQFTLADKRTIQFKYEGLTIGAYVYPGPYLILEGREYGQSSRVLLGTTDVQVVEQSDPGLVSSNDLTIREVPDSEIPKHLYKKVQKSRRSDKAVSVYRIGELYPSSDIMKIHLQAQLRVENAGRDIATINFDLIRVR